MNEVTPTSTISASLARMRRQTSLPVMFSKEASTMSASGVVAGVEQRETALFPSVSFQMTSLCGR